MHLKTNIILIFFLILSLGCKDKQSPNEYNQVDASQALEVEIPEDFMEFYHLFHADPEYQLQHIAFPLQQRVDSSLWTKENWDIHKPLAGSSEEYHLDISNFEGILIETINDKQGIFSMERRFSKSKDEWQLIYYTVKTKVF